MEERVEFKTDETRKEFFASLREANKFKSWKEFRTRLGLPRTTFQNYRFGSRLIPKKVFDSMTHFLPEGKQDFFLNQTFTKPENWGAVKGGTKGMRTILRTYNEKTIGKWRQKANRNSIKNFRKLRTQDPEKAYILLRKKKLEKALRKIKQDTAARESFFKKKEIEFNLEGLEASRQDEKRKIKIPKKLSPLLAEEIGIHLGDGTLSNKPYYFSVRGAFEEETYYTGFILPLYKELYNINPPLLKRSSACGFEISSKAVHKFKSEVLGITTGCKTYKVKVPACILKSKDKNIMRAFLRGLIDTDGCYYIRPKTRYPVISLCIKSRELINKVSEILVLLGFSPQVFRKEYTIYLNGVPKFRKWIEEIGSSNPKHLERIKKIKQMLPWSSLDRLFEELNNPSKDASLRSS